MRTHLIVAVLVLAFCACAQTPRQADDALSLSLSDPARSAADLARDRNDQPAAVLAFAGFGSGDRIADVFGGGGYYSEILARLVGKSGRVDLINNQPYHDYAKAGLEPRLADGRLPNVHYRIAPSEAMKLGTETFDGALIIMSYHDLHVSDPENGWPALDAGQFVDQIVAALKPGGVLLIVDHAAEDGSGLRDVKTRHRVDERFAIDHLRARGLVLDGTLDVLRNADDDRERNVFDAGIKGHTDRFVHRWRKPR